MNLIDILNSEAFAQVVTAVVAGVAGTLGLQKGASSLSKTRKGLAQDAAQTQVVSGMREELRRLAEQNAKLATCLNEFQTQILELRAENAELTLTVKELRIDLYKLKPESASGFGSGV